MPKEEKSKKLLMALTNKKPLKIYFEDGTYFDTFYWNEKEKIYQGIFGYMTIEKAVKIIKDGVNYILEEEE